MQSIKKVVVIGPESTGKSTLCQLLANHYKTLWCPEYAREYLLKNGRKYTFDNLLDIAKGQLALEENYTLKLVGQNNEKNKNSTPILLIDTDMTVMKVWCEYVFQKCHTYILEQIVQRKYDLYLLCNTDLAWMADELREYPDLKSREELYHIYKDILINQKIPWAEVTGNYEQRLSIAIDAIDRHITS